MRWYTTLPTAAVAAGAATVAYASLYERTRSRSMPQLVTSAPQNGTRS